MLMLSLVQTPIQHELYAIRNPLLTTFHILASQMQDYRSMPNSQLLSDDKIWLFDSVIKLIWKNRMNQLSFLLQKFLDSWGLNQLGLNPGPIHHNYNTIQTELLKMKDYSIAPVINNYQINTLCQIMMKFKKSSLSFICKVLCIICNSVWCSIYESQLFNFLHLRQIKSIFQ